MVALLVTKLDKSSEDKAPHLMRINSILSTILVIQFDKLIETNDLQPVSI